MADDHLTLTETDMDHLIMSIPEIRYRAALAGKWYLVKARLAAMEARYQRLCQGLPEPEVIASPPPVMVLPSTGDEEKAIVKWLNSLAGDAQTVRAIHTRKLAQRIANGEYKNSITQKEEG